ncbi:phosphatidylglycerophosphatase A-like protein [Terriglobus roseus DSM 18391]|uniref:Phosphatidylglycerophosphatase A-like protein n=1 Tax=Terriglobus roseus (strain DSM 18391 / NRRL B-41598 / KBS 63) TaxID=926566 RepID=I3ZDF4_TERRK|nr:phosphatidylglycerophosphatase A [Terriglobus roseus]AFL87272.1 phosphatidylglycerophosphatase A-like protein [Terriglobus roseus DSM 18391]
MSAEGNYDGPAAGLGGVKRTRWAWIAGTFFGAGFMKPGPGTYGSVAATLVWFAIARHVSIHWLPLITLGMAALATAIGIPAATRIARESGRKDPQIVVIDEVAGQWLTLVFCLPQMPFALLGLVCFRIFDILKPPPIRRLEKLPAGTGIMVDDLGAGVYALILQTVIQQAWIVWQIAAHAPKH